MITRSTVSLFGRFIVYLPDQIIVIGTGDLHPDKITGHKELTTVNKDISIYIRGIHVGSSYISSFVSHLAPRS